MKAQSKELSNSKYPNDYKDVFENLLLKNEIIEKYNSNRNNPIKRKKT